MNFLITIYVLFITLIIYYKNDESMLYKIFFYLFIFSILMFIIKYTKTLGDEFEKENIENMKTFDEKLKEEEIKRYNDYIKNQINNIEWKIPK